LILFSFLLTKHCREIFLKTLQEAIPRSHLHTIQKIKAIAPT